VQALELRLANARADRDAAVRDRYAEGVGPTQIAREVGLTRQAVYNIIGMADAEEAG
jgi:DNA invertase Pin-like site-specific DNA recombinase